MAHLHQEWNVEWVDNDSGFSVTRSIMEKDRETLGRVRESTVLDLELFFFKNTFYGRRGVFSP